MREFFLSVFVDPALVLSIGTASLIGLVVLLAVLDLGFGIRLTDRQFFAIRDGAALIVGLVVVASILTLLVLLAIAVGRSLMQIFS